MQFWEIVLRWFSDVASSTTLGFLVLAGLLSSVRVSQADPIVSFGLPAYSELGGVRAEIQGGFAELSATSSSLSSSVNYGGSLLTTISNLSTATQIGGAIGDAAAVTGALQTISSASTAESVADLVNVLSPFDTSSISGFLNQLGSSVSALNGQTLTPIQPPTLQLYYAVAVSGAARTEAIDLRAEVVQAQSTLENSITTVGNALVQLSNYQSQLNSALQVANQVESKIGSLLNDPVALLPGVGIVLSQMGADVFLLEAQIVSLLGQVSGVRNALESAQDPVFARYNELGEVVSAIDYALTATPLPSSWSTTGAGPTSPLFDLSVQGLDFSSPYPEIDGDFLLGTVTVFNRVSLGGAQSQGGGLSFNVTRVVSDPLLGAVTTTATASTPFTYIATLNIEDDPEASADYFYASALGKNFHIYEESSATFNVWGSYHSPLKISNVTLAPGSSGFITSAVPEPASLTLVGLGAVGMAYGAIRRRRQQKAVA